MENSIRQTNANESLVYDKMVSKLKYRGGVGISEY